MSQPDLICPMCLSRSAGAVKSCGGCRASGMPIALLDLERYLADVDFEIVESYWLQEAGAEAGLRDRMLSRIAQLKQHKMDRFGQFSGGIRLG